MRLIQQSGLLAFVALAIALQLAFIGTSDAAALPMEARADDYSYNGKQRSKAVEQATEQALSKRQYFSHPPQNMAQQKANQLRVKLDTRSEHQHERRQYFAHPPQNMAKQKANVLKVQSKYTKRQYVAHPGQEMQQSSSTNASSLLANTTLAGNSTLALNGTSTVNGTSIANATSTAQSFSATSAAELKASDNETCEEDDDDEGEDCEEDSDKKSTSSHSRSSSTSAKTTSHVKTTSHAASSTSTHLRVKSTSTSSKHKSTSTSSKHKSTSTSYSHIYTTGHAKSTTSTGKTSSTARETYFASASSSKPTTSSTSSKHSTSTSTKHSTSTSTHHSTSSSTKHSTSSTKPTSTSTSTKHSTTTAKTSTTVTTAPVYSTKPTSMSTPTSSVVTSSFTSAPWTTTSSLSLTASVTSSSSYTVPTSTVVPISPQARPALQYNTVTTAANTTLTLQSNNATYGYNEIMADLTSIMAWAGDDGNLTPAQKVEVVAGIMSAAARYWPELPTQYAARIMLSDMRTESDFQPGVVGAPRLDSGNSYGLFQISPAAGSQELPQFDTHSSDSVHNFTWGIDQATIGAGVGNVLIDWNSGVAIQPSNLTNDDLYRPWINIHMSQWQQSNMARTRSSDPWLWPSINDYSTMLKDDGVTTLTSSEQSNWDSLLYGFGPAASLTYKTALGSWVAGPATDGDGSYLSSGDDISAQYFASIMESCNFLYYGDGATTLTNAWLEKYGVSAGLVDYIS